MRRIGCCWCWIPPTASFRCSRAGSNRRLRFWPDGFLPSPACGRGAGGEGAAYRMLPCWIPPTASFQCSRAGANRRLRCAAPRFAPLSRTRERGRGRGRGVSCAAMLDTTNSFVPMLACWSKPTALLDVVPCCTTPLSYSLPMRGERAKTLRSGSAWAWLAAMAVKQPTASFLARRFAPLSRTRERGRGRGGCVSRAAGAGYHQQLRSNARVLDQTDGFARCGALLYHPSLPLSPHEGRESQDTTFWFRLGVACGGGG